MHDYVTGSGGTRKRKRRGKGLGMEKLVTRKRSTWQRKLKLKSCWTFQRRCFLLIWIRSERFFFFSSHRSLLFLISCGFLVSKYLFLPFVKVVGGS